MTNRTFDIVMSLAFVLYGLLIVILPNPTILRPNSPSEFGINLTNVRWIVGPGLILGGSWVLIKTVRTKPYKMVLFKCTGCGFIEEKDNISTHKCKKCNKHMEQLEGFFDRHPEFKENSSNKKT